MIVIWFFRTKYFLIRFVHHLVTFAWHNWNITYDERCVQHLDTFIVGYTILNSFLIPHLDTLYQLSQKCVTYRKYIHRSILHFSLGEIGMGRNIMCFLSWLACFLFFANIGYRACPSKVLNVFLLYVVFMGISMTMCVSCYTRPSILIKTIF